MAKWTLRRIASLGASTCLLLSACGDGDATVLPNESVPSAAVSSTTVSPTTVSPSTAPSSTTPSSLAPVDTAPPTTTAASLVRVLGTTPDGRFTYSVSYRYANPDGGYAGNGKLFVDAGEGAAPAIADDRDEFDQVEGLAFGPGGLVAWTAVDASYGAQVYLGRVGENGKILDVHRIGEDGNQLSSGATFDAEGRLNIPTRDGVQVHDTSTDPFFVMTAGVVPTINVANPLVSVAEADGYWARDDPGFWYRGDTLGSAPACGAETLYKDDADGFARVLAGDVEIDRVVAVLATPLQSTVGADAVGASRGVVVTTECPEKYAGQRVLFGFESFSYGDGGPRWELPLVLVPVAGGEVRSVIAIREVLADNGLGDDYLAAIEIDLVRPAGNEETITLSRN